MNVKANYLPTKSVLSTLALVILSLCLFSCGGQNQNKDEGQIEETVQTEEEIFEEPSEEDILYVASGNINGHDYVDLGLPSGLKWATCNVGASKPEEYGDYYGWGETSMKKSGKNEDYKTWFVSGKELYQKGIIDSNGKLTPLYDAANQNWGSSWRMPTPEEFRELEDNCNMEEFSWSGVTGLLLTSKINGNSIFFPYAGTLKAGKPLGPGKTGAYWNSTMGNVDNMDSAYTFITWKGFKHYVDYRHTEHSVRAVTE